MINKFETRFRRALEDYEVINTKWRMKIVNRKIINKSDYAEIFFLIYPPNCSNPHMATVNINFVRSIIMWDTLNVTPDRIKSSYANSLLEVNKS